MPPGCGRNPVEAGRKRGAVHKALRRTGAAAAVGVNVAPAPARRASARRACTGARAGGAARQPTIGAARRGPRRSSGARHAVSQRASCGGCSGRGTAPWRVLPPVVARPPVAAVGPLAVVLDGVQQRRVLRDARRRGGRGGARGLRRRAAQGGRDQGGQCPSTHRKLPRALVLLDGFNEGGVTAAWREDGAAGAACNRMERRQARRSRLPRPRASWHPLPGSGACHPPKIAEIMSCVAESGSPPRALRHCQRPRPDARGARARSRGCRPRTPG